MKSKRIHRGKHYYVATRDPKGKFISFGRWTWMKWMYRRTVGIKYPYHGPGKYYWAIAQDWARTREELKSQSELEKVIKENFARDPKLRFWEDWIEPKFTALEDAGRFPFRKGDIERGVEFTGWKSTP